MKKIRDEILKNNIQKEFLPEIVFNLKQSKIRGKIVKNKRILKE